jgi:hypothetical protein
MKLMIEIKPRFSLSVSSVSPVVVAVFEVIGLRLRLARMKAGALVASCGC